MKEAVGHCSLVRVWVHAQRMLENAHCTAEDQVKAYRSRVATLEARLGEAVDALNTFKAHSEKTILGGSTAAEIMSVHRSGYRDLCLYTQCGLEGCKG